MNHVGKYQFQLLHWRQFIIISYYIRADTFLEVLAKDRRLKSLQGEKEDQRCIQCSRSSLLNNTIIPWYLPIIFTQLFRDAFLLHLKIGPKLSHEETRSHNKIMSPPSF